MMFKTIVFFSIKQLHTLTNLKYKEQTIKQMYLAGTFAVNRIFPIIIKSLSDKQNRIPSYL